MRVHHHELAGSTQRCFGIDYVVDDRPTKTAIPVVKNRELTRRHGSLWFVEFDHELSVRRWHNFTSLIRLAIADLNHAAHRLSDRECLWRLTDPACVARFEAVAVEEGVLSLHHDQDIGFQVLTGDVPRLITGILAATDAKPLSLTDRVVHQSTVLANRLALRRLYQPWVRRQVG